MIRSRRFRTALVLIMLAAVAAVWWSFSGRTSLTSRVTAIVLGEDVSTRITDFEHVERRDGRVLFRLLAEENTENRGGTSLLSRVWLEHYDDAGQLIETVQGRRARYDRSTGEVLFEEEVIVELADGTRVLGEALRADLKTGVIRIQEAFDLERAELKGSGRGLVYETGDRVLEVSQLGSLGLPLADGRVEASSRRMLYDLRAGTFRFLEAARLQGPVRSLQGDEIVLQTDPDRRLERVDAAGAARLEADALRSFDGQLIRLHFEPAAGRLTHFEVFGSPESESLAQPRQASFTQKTAAGGHRLESKEMVGRAGGDPPVLHELEASGEVVLRSSELGIEDSEAARLLARFVPKSGGLESLRMEGGVEIVRQAPGESRREYLRSRRLDVDVESSGRLSRLSAREAVNLETVDGSVRRDLVGRERVDLHYVGGRLAAAEAAGDAILDVREPGSRSVIRAPAISAAFRQGQIERVEAGPGVETELEAGEVRRRTRSHELVATYRGGKLQEAVQSGQVRLWESTGEGVVEVQSERARLLPGDRLVAAGGRVLMRNEQEAGRNRQETLADEIEFDRARGTVVASGRVETVTREGAEPTIITAGRMEFVRASGQARYTDNPRMVSGPTTVRGRDLTVGQEELTVTGAVRSELVEEGAGEPARYTVQAADMHYPRAEGVITYTGDVSLTGQDLSVRAPQVKLFLDPTHREVEKIVASGGAEIVQQGRRWTGETATYYPAGRRVVVGSPQ